MMNINAHTLDKQMAFAELKPRQQKENQVFDRGGGVVVLVVIAAIVAIFLFYINVYKSKMEIVDRTTKNETVKPTD